ncbi:MAG: TonB-dependent receptor [Bacteroidota bacterium]
MVRLLILTAVFSLASSLCAQGIRDSVFRIEAVNITAEQIFKKEQAGMKETEVDSTVLQKKVNVSLSDLLSENTPVFIKNHGRGALATASFRGTSASHTQVSWNGIPINSPMAGMVDFSLIPVYVIDELNLKHGSASLADRSGGIGGSIHINNSANWGDKRIIKYMQGVGSYRSFDEFLQLGFGKSRIRSKTRLYHNHSRNDYTFINRGIGNIDPVTGSVTNPLDTNDHAAYTRYGLLQELYFRPHADHLLSLQYWGQYANRAIPRSTSYEGPDNSNLNNQQDLDHKLVADWKFYTGYGKVILRSGYSGKKLDYTQMNRVPGLGLVPAVYSESMQRSFVNTLSNTYEFAEDLSIEGAVDMNLHHVNSRDTVSKTGYELQRSEISLFFAMHKSIAKKMNLKLMLRQEWVDGKRVPVIPYLGADYRLFSGLDLLIKGNVARNYHQPTLNDLYWQPGGNPDLLPEKGFTMETGMEFQHLLSGHLLKAEFTLYRSKIDQWIIWIPSYQGFWEPRNIDQVESKGLEYDMQVEGNLWSVYYKITGSYAFTRSVNYGDSLVWSDASYGKQLVYIPLHSGNMMLHLSWKNIFITYQYNAYSERYTTSSNDVTRRDWLYPYFMNDLAAGAAFRLRKQEFTAELKVRNLFDEAYHSILYRPMPGRNYHLLISFKL